MLVCSPHLPRACADNAVAHAAHAGEAVLHAARRCHGEPGLRWRQIEAARVGVAVGRDAVAVLVFVIGRHLDVDIIAHGGLERGAIKRVVADVDAVLEPVGEAAQLVRPVCPG